MERKEFLKKAGLGLLTSPLLLACKPDEEAPTPGSCAVTDTETDGPYPLYNSRGSAVNRVDISEGKPGLPLQMNLIVRNVNDGCNLLPNARVDIWYCDKDGYYSGYTNSGYLGTQNNTSATFCRGLQTTDANGVAKFKGIYPGWYQGRVTHLHVQVYVNNTLKLTSQIAFPEEINTAVYNTDLYKAHGQNPTKNTTDGIIRDSLDNELATVVASAATGGYDLTHTLYVNA